VIQVERLFVLLAFPEAEYSLAPLFSMSTPVAAGGSGNELIISGGLQLRNCPVPHRNTNINFIGITTASIALSKQKSPELKNPKELMVMTSLLTLDTILLPR
jgi:hypothetical protein